MLDKAQSYRLIDFVLEQTRGYPTRVMVNSQAEGLTRYANSEVHQNVFEDVTSITITVTDDNRRSRVTTTTVDEEELKAAVSDALENLEFIPDGDAQPPLVSEPGEIDADEYDGALAEEFDVEARARLVGESVGTLAEGFEAYGRLSHQQVRLAVGNSEGIKRYARDNSVNFSALVSGSGGSGYAEGTSVRAGELDVEEIFGRAYEKAKMNQERVELQPGRYTVILEPMAVGNILTYLSFIGFSAKSVQQRASFLTGKMDQEVFDERISIVDDHTHPQTVSLPFDFEGYPRQVVSLVADGVMKGLIYDGMSAMADGVESTGHSVDMPQRGGIPIHLVMSGGDSTLEEIIARTDDALLVTRFHYMNVVNPREALLTGLTRDGVFRIQNGRITGAVKNMRFTDSMLRALNSLVEISSDREKTPFFFGNFYLPALKIEGFHFTGKTDA